LPRPLTVDRIKEAGHGQRQVQVGKITGSISAQKNEARLRHAGVASHLLAA
jgi:hypothetical protein